MATGSVYVWERCNSDFTGGRVHSTEVELPYLSPDPGRQGLRGRYVDVISAGSALNRRRVRREMRVVLEGWCCERGMDRKEALGGTGRLEAVPQLGAYPRTSHSSLIWPPGSIVLYVHGAGWSAKRIEGASQRTNTGVT